MEAASGAPPAPSRSAVPAAVREAFERNGFAFRPGVFSPAEMDVLEAALAGISDPEHPGVSVEAASGTVRMSFGAHTYSEAFRRLALHPRLAEPARDLLGDDVYVYQSRLNLKAGLSQAPAGGYPWHQDFSTWHLRDGMAAPRALVVFVFLDDVTPCNAPLLVIPGSHQAGFLDSGERTPAGSPYRQIVIGPEVLRDLVDRHGIAAQIGPRGSVLFMHCNLVHGSTENISPLRRALFSVTFNAVGNPVAAPARPDLVVSRDRQPVVPLADDCLLQPIV
jgi:ectoine hydroxylase